MQKTAQIDEITVKILDLYANYLSQKAGISEKYISILCMMKKPVLKKELTYFFKGVSRTMHEMGFGKPDISFHHNTVETELSCIEIFGGNETNPFSLVIPISHFFSLSGENAYEQ